MARVFLSHSSKDKPFVRELHRRLKRDGVVCFFDEESIELGANFVVSLERGIDECEFFVAVLSPEFVQSKWVKLERTSAMADDPAGSPGFSSQSNSSMCPRRPSSKRTTPGFARAWAAPSAPIRSHRGTAAPCLR